MPTLTRRQRTLAPRQLAKARPSIENHECTDKHPWIVDEDYETPQKEVDLPSAPLVKIPSKKNSRANLRIDTYTSTGLHARYESSEEEPSPSPDSETEELKHKTPATYSDYDTESSAGDEYKAEIAVAVPIFVGRPKLVDITKLAPMYRRKRTAKPMLSRPSMKLAASRLPAIADENSPFVAQEVTMVGNTQDELPKRKDSLSTLGADAPESWLPDDATAHGEEKEHYFPDLELRNPPTYTDYDPYSLDPPRLSPRNSYAKSGKKPGSVARARTNSIPPNAMNHGWKGLGRTLSLTKKQTLLHSDHQLVKKPKMIARAANEREEIPTIPAFPFGDDID
ncbi:hypothetical protein P7C71_g3371, partial [Lecanoromycetidae sp. Uapishka_2]